MPGLAAIAYEGSLSERHKEHEQILDAIESGDGNRVEFLLTEHLALSRPGPSTGKRCGRQRQDFGSRLRATNSRTRTVAVGSAASVLLIDAEGMLEARARSRMP